jgi:hypothetical protein
VNGEKIKKLTIFMKEQKEILKKLGLEVSNVAYKTLKVRLYLVSQESHCAK